MMKIAFLGLGNMGGPMAINLVMAGYKMVGFDPDKSTAEAMSTAGISMANSSAEAVRSADVVMTSLPGPKQVESVAFADENILDAMPSGAIWIDLSTNSLSVGRQIATAAQTRGIETLDAPVSGGIEGAAAGSLSVYVGGKAEVFAKVKAIFDVIGDDVKHLGHHGAGYVAKIAQVTLCYLNSIALSEAMMLGVKGGVDADAMLGVIQNSTGRSYAAGRYGPAILDGSYDEGFVLGLAHKDMKLALELAESTDTQLPMCEQVEETYKRAVDTYGFNENHLMAVKLLEDANNTLIRGKLF